MAKAKVLTMKEGEFQSRKKNRIPDINVRKNAI